MNRFVILFAISLIVSMPFRAGAAGMDIGMSTWFCWWDPSWNNNFSSFRITPTFFYGPGLSFRLPANVTISSSFMYGRVKTKGRMIVAPPHEMKREIQRYDSDSVIAYSFSRIFKLFAGFKYSNYNYAETVPIIGSRDMFSIAYNKTIYNEYAPAVGFGVTIHLVDHLYLVMHASVVYMFSSMSRSSRILGILSGEPPYFFIYPRDQWSVNKMGANIQVAFAYFIKAINMRLSLGFRYQFYKTVKSDSDQDQYTRYYDHFYGITASAVYRIDFKKKEESTEGI